MEGPTEMPPYSLPWVDPSLLKHITLFSASVILADKTPETGSRIGTAKRHTREEMVEIDINSPLAAWTFDARAAYEHRVARNGFRNTRGIKWGIVAPRSAVGHMDHGQCKHGRSQIWR